MDRVGHFTLRLFEAFDIINMLSKGYLYVVRYMSSFSDQLHNVITHGFPPTHVVDKSTNETLMNIEVVAHNLESRSNHLLKRLHAIKRHSLGATA